MTSDVRYIAGTPYVGATADMFAGPGGYRGEFMAWDPGLHLADAKTRAADTVPEPDVVRPSVPSEEPQPDDAPGLPQPGPDVVVPPRA